MKSYKSSSFSLIGILLFLEKIRVGYLFSAITSNMVFLFYLLFYVLRDNSPGSMFQFLLHVSIMLILFVIPGFVTASLLRRNYTDIVHFGAYISALSTISVFLLKLLLNISGVQISAMTFFAVILVYTNVCLLLQRKMFSRLQKKYILISDFIETRNSSKRKFSVNAKVLLMSLVICILLLVTTEYAAMTIPIVKDSDCWLFGTYDVMTKSVAKVGYYEEAQSNVYPDYTPYLMYALDHPPTTFFNSAYSATLGGYFEYSKIFNYDLLVEQGPEFDPEFRGLHPAKEYIAINRVPMNYYITLVGIILLLFMLKLTKNSQIAFIASIYIILKFWNYTYYKLMLTAEPLWIFYSFLILYFYLYVKDDSKFVFVLGFLCALTDQKIFEMILAIFLVDIIKCGWRFIKNPVYTGFLVGTSSFILYGLLVDTNVFISNFFVLHLYDRFFHPFIGGLPITSAWGQYIFDWVGFLEFVILVCLSLLFIREYYKSSYIILFVYFATSVVIGSLMWPYILRYLIPSFLLLVLMASVSVNCLVKKRVIEDIT